MKTAIVIGSFDAFHNGHYDLITYGLGLFDRLVIEISDDAKKKYWFSGEERMEMVKEALSEFSDRIIVHYNENQLKDLGDICKKYDTTYILRGIKAGRTLNDELRLQNVYRFLLGKLHGIEPQFVYKLTSDADFRGSSIVKTYADNEAVLSSLVPHCLVGRIMKRKMEVSKGEL